MAGVPAWGGVWMGDLSPRYSQGNPLGVPETPVPSKQWIAPRTELAVMEARLAEADKILDRIEVLLGTVDLDALLPGERAAICTAWACAREKRLAPDLIPESRFNA